MISFNQLSMAYGSRLLFFEVDLLLSEKTCYALVGANGAGKSTLLKLMTGEEEASSGSVSIPKDASVGWLKQDQYRYEDTKIIEVVIQGKPLLWRALVEKENLLASGEWNEKIGYRLGEIEETIAHFDGYTAETFAAKLLTGLGVHSDYHQQPLKALSGGYKLRVLLAQALFQQPDILLLDEPTNHLDIVSIDWLEKYLKTEFAGMILFISHDIAFINRLADHILDVDYGEIRQYSGNYTKFLAEKKLIEEQKLQIKTSMEKKIAEMQSFVDRFRAKASKARQAQSRMKMIEKLELPDIKQSSRISPHFNFKPKQKSGKQILTVSHLTKSYKDKNIFKDLNFKIHRGEKVAIIGANGIGKSTLVKSFLNKIEINEGTCEWGHGTDISYFSQDHHDLLNKSMDVFTWLNEQLPACPENQIRKALGQVLFTKDEVEKNILALSGGEAARLLLAKIMLEVANVLVMDEPTNHMDIEATDALANSLQQFTGTLLLVSHNRHFINQIANRILYISHDKKLIDFKGSYAEFEQKHLLGE